MLYDVLLLSLRSSDSWGWQKNLRIRASIPYHISWPVDKKSQTQRGDFKARQKQTKETNARYFGMSSIPLSKISRAVQLVNRSTLRNFWQCLWLALTPRPTFFLVQSSFARSALHVFLWQPDSFAFSWLPQINLCIGCRPFPLLNHSSHLSVWLISFRMWIPLHHVSLSSLRLSRSLCVWHWQRPLHHVLDLHNQWIQRHHLLHIVHSVCAGRPHWLTKKLFRDQGRKSLSCSGPHSFRGVPSWCSFSCRWAILGWAPVWQGCMGITWVCSTHCFGSTHWLGLLMLSFGGGRCSLYEIIAPMSSALGLALCNLSCAAQVLCGLSWRLRACLPEQHRHSSL